MSFKSAALTAIKILLLIPGDLSIAALKVGHSFLDAWAGVALKRQLTLMIYTAMDWISVSNGRRSQKQQSKCVVHSAFKLSNAPVEIGAPASLRKNLYFSAVLAVFLLAGGCSDQATQYTGIWKNRCDDYWGVQIKPNASGLYAVTFCGLSGCLGPGEWLPDTPIVDDPTYQVISPKQIRIIRAGHESLIYSRCSKDPDWKIDLSNQ